MNSITMKMQADKLIRMALQEDITSEDVSTNAVMRSAVRNRRSDRKGRRNHCRTGCICESIPDSG